MTWRSVAFEGQDIGTVKGKSGWRRSQNPNTMGLILGRTEAQGAYILDLISRQAGTQQLTHRHGRLLGHECGVSGRLYELHTVST